jgi:hypothetical protein
VMVAATEDARRNLCQIHKNSLCVAVSEVRFGGKKKPRDKAIFTPSFQIV